MPTVNVDGNFNVIYKHCYACRGIIITTVMTTSLHLNEEGIQMFVALIGDCGVYKWKRTGAARCHMHCYECYDRLNVLKKELARKPYCSIPTKHIRFQRVDNIDDHIQGIKNKVRDLILEF